MTKLRRGRTERLPRGRLVLQKRDEEILRSLLEYRVLSSRQLADLFFSQKSAADRRLRLLYDHALLDRIVLPVATGSPELLYTIGPHGADHLRANLGVESGQMSWRRRLTDASLGYLHHRLDLNRFRLAVTMGARHMPGYRLVSWKDGFSLGRLRPDAFFALDTPRGSALFFVEVDRSTETTRTFQNKLKLYHRYWRQGAFENRFAAKHFRVLTGVPNASRLRALVKAASDVPAPILFWFSELSSISPHTVFAGDIWISADRPEEPVCL